MRALYLGLYLAAVSFTLAACGATCPEPQYDGKASDEAYKTLVDGEARATVDDAKAATLQLTDGMSFPAATVPTFYWTSSLTASAAPPPVKPAPAPWYRDLFISSAWAHLPPVTGAIFWLKITVPGQQCPVELLSTRTQWTPTAEVWATLSKGTGARKIDSRSAYLIENRISEGEFKPSSAVTFTVSQ
jgi:hypothetical protein